MTRWMYPRLPPKNFSSVRQEIADDGEALPLDVCFTVRPGKDLTLVSWGAMLHETLLAADRMQEEGISCEVIDVATVKPLDAATILESVARTGRCVIVHEAARTAGFGAEIAAQLAEHGLLSLFAPVQRVTGPDTVMPLLRLEDRYLPGIDAICGAVHRTLEFS